MREFEAAKKDSLVHSAVDLWVEKTRANDGILMAVLREAARERNKSFIIKGRGSSVVEQPIRNRQVAGSSPALGSNVSRSGPDT